MNIKKISQVLRAGLVVVATFATASLCAQNLQSVSSYSRTHEKLLASQNHIQDQIRLEEARKYASHLYEESEPELDIYTEGWDCGLVNPYRNAVVPDTKDIDVTNFYIPVPGVLTSPYGYRPRFRRQHKGVDLNLNVGDTVRAAFTGRVRLTNFERKGYGYYVIIRHENGLETVYGHLSRFLVKPDQYVKAGDPIALGGNTGLSTGPHLHFETRFMGVAINPAAIFDFENKTTHTDVYTFNKHSYGKARDYSPRSRSRYASRRSKSKTNEYGSRGSRETYKVKSGDNLGSIAAKHGTTVAKLRRLNGLGNSSNIRAGKTLRVK